MLNHRNPVRLCGGIGLVPLGFQVFERLAAVIYGQWWAAPVPNRFTIAWRGP